MRFALVSAALLIATAAVAQEATRRLTLDMPAPVYRAAVQRVGGERPTAAETKAAVEAWALKRLTDDLSPELTALRLAAAEKVEADEPALNTLTPEQCAAIAKVLGAPLKRCGFPE